MKPISLCLVNVGKRGLEMVESYPKVLSIETVNQIILKSMPFGAKPGDFHTTSTGNNSFSGFVFRVPSEDAAIRDNLAAIVAVFDTEDYNSILVKKLFSTVVQKLQENNLVKMETITKLLPEMYKGMNKDHFKMKISSVVLVEFEFRSESKQENKTESKVSDVRRELWT